MFITRANPSCDSHQLTLKLKQNISVASCCLLNSCSLLINTVNNPLFFRTFLKHAWLHTGLMNNMEKLHAPGPSMSQSLSHSPELIRSETNSTHNQWLQHAGKQQHKQKPEKWSTVYGANRWNKSFVTHIRTMLASKCVFCVFSNDRVSVSVEMIQLQQLALLPRMNDWSHQRQSLDVDVFCSSFNIGRIRLQINSMLYE